MTEHHPILSDLAGVLSSIRQTEKREGKSWSSFGEHSVTSSPLVGTDRTISSTDFTGERVSLSQCWSGFTASDLYSEAGSWMPKKEKRPIISQKFKFVSNSLIVAQTPCITSRASGTTQQNSPIGNMTLVLRRLRLTVPSSPLVR